MGTHAAVISVGNGVVKANIAHLLKSYGVHLALFVPIFTAPIAARRNTNSLESTACATLN